MNSMPYFAHSVSERTFAPAPATAEPLAGGASRNLGASPRGGTCRPEALTGGSVRELYPGSAHADPVRQPARGRFAVLCGRGSELGMATAEYAIATLAAVGFAGILVVILRSEEVRGFLLNLIRTALSLP